jgi:hypothetical protein
MKTAQLPFVHLFSDSDIATIAEIRDLVSPKYQRSKRVKHFTDCLSLLISFVDQSYKTNWKRALLCGICVCDDFIAVNNGRLQGFTSRCKSSINDLFAKMGYRTIPINHENQGLIIAKIPFLKTHYEELRQWTYRTRTNKSSEIEIAIDKASPVETNISASFSDNHLIVCNTATDSDNKKDSEALFAWEDEWLWDNSFPDL